LQKNHKKANFLNVTLKAQKSTGHS